MLRFIIAFVLSVSAAAWAAESPYDTYSHATECPENGPAYEAGVVDTRAFIRCQCTSYVAQKLSERMTARYYSNGAPSGLVKNFANGSYYMPQDRRWTSGPNSGQRVDRWSHAVYWRDSALYAGIGVTGAWDNFTWDEKSYNAVFPGDVAWWDEWTGNRFGHVAIVESVTPDSTGRGVACVVVSDYNMRTHTFDRRTLCKSTHSTADARKRFPDAFLHIDRDHSYCTANPTKDNCQALWGGQMVASVGTKADGLGGGGVTSSFNLKQDTDILDPATGTEWIAGEKTLTPGMTVRIRTDVKAVNGNATAYMRPGKDKVEVDFYVRLDDGEWNRISRQYIRATNLSSGDTKTESVLYTIPHGIREVSFKVKIDAEDEASESNEGDNWSRVETFQVETYAWLIPLILQLLED